MALIAVVDDEEGIRFTFESFLSEQGHQVSTAGDYDQGLALLEGDNFDLVFSDIVLGGKSGIDLLEALREKGVSAPVVMITAYPSVSTAAEAVRLGAFDYITKPVRFETLLNVTRLALQHKRTLEERERYRVNLEATFNSVKEGLVTVDRDLRVVQMNDAAREICGHKSESVGRDFSSLPLPCTRRCGDALRGVLETGKPAEVLRISCRHQEDNPRLVSLSVWPLTDRSGSFSGAVMAVRDESRLANLERELSDRRGLHGIIGKSRAMQRVYSLIEALSEVDTTVLISGETGTGKELVAEALHYSGVRAAGPLVKVNCSALSPDLLESELFGHVRGAFTGAVSDKVGRFEKAKGGSIFLDEIGDTSARVQASLLRVLQEKEYERVGDTTPLKADVRVMAATNRDLQEMVRRRDFREDLYYRLKVVEIRLPPLRDRGEDIALLCAHFLKGFNAGFNRNVRALSDDVRKLFSLYPWPGNVRELRHAIEHAFVVSRDDDVIMMSHLPASLQEHAKATLLVPGRVPDHERIRRALEQAGGNKARAARLLGVDRRTLYRKMKLYGMPF